MVEYISNIAVKTNTLKPQGIIKGNLTVANGVLSGFSSSAYFEVAGGRQDNSELVVKFTTPSTASSENEVIVHSDVWESVEINTSGKLFTWNWSASSSITLITSLSYPQTYYIKSIHSGQQRTYYTSTDGETWTQVADFTETGIDISKQYAFRLGNSSISRNLGRPFTGTIDLNECYMNVNDSQFWKGMDYYDFQQIGGDSFDGGWIDKYVNIGNDISIDVKGTNTHDISSYLPDNIYDYEILIDATGTTSSTSGDAISLYAFTGNSAADNYLRLGRAITRTNSTRFYYSSGRLVLPAGTRSFSIYNESQAGTYNLDLRMYRRINHNSGCEKVNLSGAERKIGGEQFDGQWVWKASTLANNITIDASTTLTYDITDYLPNDGYAYEILLGDNQANTGSTSGNNILLWTYTDMLSTSNQARFMGINTRTASTQITHGGVVIIPVHRERKVYIRNSSNSAGNSVYITLKAYRRLGTND